MSQNIKLAIKFDQEICNNFWQDEISTEMDHIKDFQAFRPLKKVKKSSVDNKCVSVKMCFDVKVDLRRKA